ncbi:MAG: hypothetical protein ACYDAG_09255 [Chloroflexota bacterium]
MAADRRASWARITFCAGLVSAALTLSSGGIIMAEPADVLPPGVDVSISLPAGGSLAYDVPALAPVTLHAGLSFGDLDLAIATADGSTTYDNSFSGSGSGDLSLPPTVDGSPYRLLLSSRDGAFLTFTLSPGSPLSPSTPGSLSSTWTGQSVANSGTSGSSSSSSGVGGSSESSSSSSSVRVQRSVTTSSGGSAVSTGSSSVEIHDSQVTITSN